MVTLLNAQNGLLHDRVGMKEPQLPATATRGTNVMAAAPHAHKSRLHKAYKDRHHQQHAILGYIYYTVTLATNDRNSEENAEDRSYWGKREDHGSVETGACVSSRQWECRRPCERPSSRGASCPSVFA